MGDRANIIINSQYGAPIFLYAHWGGEVIPGILRTALRRTQRWDDPAYLSRIIFCEMVSDDIKGETGYGISTYPPDNEHDWLIVDTAAQRVEVRQFEWTDRSMAPLDCPVLHSWTFAEYVESSYRFDDDEREADES